MLIADYAPGHPAWLDIMVNDTASREGLMAFCTEVFGWTFTVGGPDTAYYSMAHANGVPVAGIGQMEGSPAQWTTYLATKDIDATAAKATELGAMMMFGPIDVMDAGRLAIISDPAGAVFGLWEQKDFAGTGVYGEPNTPGWWNHTSSDPKIAAKFYCELFGLAGMEANGGYMIAISDSDQAFASISPNPAPDDMPPHWAPIILSADLAVTRERVTGAGGELMFESMDVPGGTITAFKDSAVGAFLTAFQPAP